MLSLGLLSVSSSIKLLERSLKFRVLSFNRVLQEAIQGLSPAANTVQVKAFAVAADTRPAAVTAEPKTPGLKIAKTTMPDSRLDYNQTFQHIRTELDVYYKERNPIFSNTIARSRR